MLRRPQPCPLTPHPHFITPPPHGQHTCHHTTRSVKKIGDESLFCSCPAIKMSLPHYICRFLNQQQHSTIPNCHWRISQCLKPSASIVHHKDLSEDDASVATTSFLCGETDFTISNGLKWRYHPACYIRFYLSHNTSSAALITFRCPSDCVVWWKMGNDGELLQHNHICPPTIHLPPAASIRFRRPSDCVVWRKMGNDGELLQHNHICLSHQNNMSCSHHYSILFSSFSFLRPIIYCLPTMSLRPLLRLSAEKRQLIIYLSLIYMVVETDFCGHRQLWNSAAYLETVRRTGRRRRRRVWWRRCAPQETVDRQEKQEAQGLIIWYVISFIS